MSNPLKPDRASQSAIDKRTYIRLRSIFPVEFAVVHAPQDVLDLYWQQGYTRNVGKGGICLEMIASDEETLRRLQSGPATLDLRIGIPLRGVPLKAQAKVSWFEKVPNDATGKYRVGLKFTSISYLDLNRMVNHARWIKNSSYIAAFVSVSFFVLLILAGIYGYRLRQINEGLINRLVATQQEEIRIHAAIQEIIDEGNVVLEQIEGNELGEEEQRKLENAYEELVERKDKVEDELVVLEREKEGLQATVLEKMHLWLKNHQNPSTGLIMSAGRDGAEIKNYAFIYDQALAVNVFLAFENDKSARQILDFFSAYAKEGFNGFYNAYNVESGEIEEVTVRSGPNIWIGVAALQYIYSTGDKYYLPMVRRIADWLIALQENDPGGGIRGGPGLSWLAVEHNLDAYALFTMMHKITQEPRYHRAGEKVLSWLKDNGMVPSARKYERPPASRGRGDATLATDTYAWALAALGPETLKAISMDPEQIMEFAEGHCAIEVQFQRPSGIDLSVRGFDFAKAVHMPRGGLISPEWTAQMVVAFRILSEYFVQRGDFYKATYYEEKAQIYLGELNKLIISSPSEKGQGEGCLPHATQTHADTGHGWVTSYGTSSCSVAGTAYMIMAMKHWNPLILERGNIKLKAMEGYL